MEEAQERINEWVSNGDKTINLDLSWLQLTSLPELPSNLQVLLCFNNNLTSLPELPSSLLNLRCFRNNLMKLPDLPSGLKYLNFNERIRRNKTI